MAKKIKNIKKKMIKRVTLDPIYKSYWYSKFVNKLMFNGKKHVIEKIMANIWYNMKVKYRAKPIDIFFASIIQLRPLMGSLLRRVGVVYKNVPVPLAPRRQLVIALKWLTSQIKMEPELDLRSRIFRTFSGLVQKKSKKRNSNLSTIAKKKKLHYAALAKDRINTYYRWA